MKRSIIRIILAAALTVALALSLSSCDMLPDEIKELIGAKKMCEHAEVEWVVDTPSTCKVEGMHHSECKACGAIVKGQAKLELGEHTLGEWETETESTCKAKGTKYRKCTVCKCKVETEEIPLSETHAYNLGSCTICSEEQSESEGLNFTSLGSGKAAVTGIGSCTDSSLVIPSVTPSGERVVSIGVGAFSGKSNITSVIIPDSVETVGSDAFRGTSLNAASVPAAVVGAVRCETLEKLIVTGTGVIPSGCMNAASNLHTLTVCDGVTEIGESAFSGSPKLQNVILPDSLTKIGKSSFARCNAIVSVKLGAGVTYIGDSAFSGAYSITNITIPAAVRYIGIGAFASRMGSSGSINMSKLVSVTFEETDGWYSTDNTAATSGVAVESTMLADKAEAAVALHTTYAYQCLKRS